MTMIWTVVLQNQQGEMQQRTMMGPHGGMAMEQRVNDIIHHPSEPKGWEIVVLIKGTHEVHFVNRTHQF